MNHPVLGGTGTNTWHARTSGPLPGAEADLEDLADMLNSFYVGVSTVMPVGTAIGFSGEWQEVMSEDPDFVSNPPWTIGAGGNAGPLPAHCALVVGWRTSAGGRTGRGRTFVGPLGNSALQTDGTIDTTKLTEVRAAATALVAASSAFDNGAFGVYSRDALATVPAPVFRDFTGTVTRDVFASLRSRRD